LKHFNYFSVFKSELNHGDIDPFYIWFKTKIWEKIQSLFKYFFKIFFESRCFRETWKWIVVVFTKFVIHLFLDLHFNSVIAGSDCLNVPVKIVSFRNASHVINVYRVEQGNKHTYARNQKTCKSAFVSFLIGELTSVLNEKCCCSLSALGRNCLVYWCFDYFVESRQSTFSLVEASFKLCHESVVIDVLVAWEVFVLSKTMWFWSFFGWNDSIVEYFGNTPSVARTFDNRDGNVSVFANCVRCAQITERKLVNQVAWFFLQCPAWSVNDHGRNWEHEE